MKKKIICVLVSCLMCFVSYPHSVAESAVIEPKLVHTERWKTSYYIDDNRDTLYPYIQCVANIYSNGYVHLWMWNTHEWDGYANFYNDITLSQSVPYCTDSREYSLMKSGQYVEYDSVYKTKKRPDIDLSYYPAGYTLQGGGGLFISDFREWNQLYYDVSSTYGSYTFEESLAIRAPGANLALCHLPFLDENAMPDLDLYDIGLYQHSYFSTSREDVITKTNIFRLFGHDIVVTPEMLKNDTPTQNDESGKSDEELVKYKALYEKAVAQSEEKDAQIASLNETIEMLKSEIEDMKTNQLKCGDTDGNDSITIADSIILNRYLAGTVESLPCKNPPPQDEPED